MHGPAVPGPALLRPAEPRPAPLLGAWQLDRRLHGGELAEVYEARPASAPPETPCRYVVKRLGPRWEAEPRAIETLEREATIGREVRHPHLIAVLDAQFAAPPYYVVMPRLDGRPLSALLAAGRLLEPALALWFARQTAEALAALHASRWLHADVKPANMLVGPDGHVTLLDLGLARNFDESGSVADRWLGGTPNYIAPEMITSAGQFDARSDLYSLGATLYEMLAGRPPYEGRDLAEIAGEHRQSQPPPLRGLVPDLPRPIAELVHRLLANEPLRRPESAAALITELVPLEIATLPQQIAA